MKKTLKRLLASLMVVVIVLTAAPLNGFVGLELPDLFSFFAGAKSEYVNDTILTGAYGDNITYKFDLSTETLTLYGSGDMMDNPPKISSYVLSGDLVVRNIVIEKGITSIGSNAFSGYGIIESVTIPDSVKKIGGGAFSNCKKLENISIPESVTSIGSSAFKWCGNLKDIKIPSGIKIIESSTFEACTNLTDIVIPEGVTTIKNSAFYSCTSLASITLPDSVTSVEYKAFDNTAYYKNTDNWDNGALYIGKYLIATNGSLPERYTIKEGTRTIGYTAFSGSLLTSITIPDSVVSIEAYAFNNCSNLKEVNISDISAWCNILFTDGSSNPTFNGADLMLNGNKITSLVIPNGINKINNYAFFNCKSITKVVIPGSVTRIGDYAFYDCSNLASIEIPDGVTEIGVSAFQYCRILTDVILPKSLVTINNLAFSFCESITSIIIPEGVTKIGDRAFFFCTSAKEISISKSVTSLGQDAFESTCYINDESNWDKTGWRRSLYIDDCLIATTYYSEDSFIIKDGTRLIGAGVFTGCEFDTIIIPDSVTVICDYAFYRCDLITLTIPNSVTTIGDGAFCDCEHLKSIIIPDSVTSIGEYSFSQCDSLVNLLIPDSVVSIGDYAFEWSMLKSVTIMANAEIGNYAFRNCNSLESITLGDKVKGIGAYAFNSCDNLTKIKIGNAVSSIDEYAFYECKSLVSITIPDCVTYIGEYSFGKCESLTNIIIGSGVETIGDSAFYCCYGLENVVLSEGVKRIGNLAFNSCRIENITIPASVVSIGLNAFKASDVRNVKISGISAWNNIDFYNEYSNPLIFGGNLILNGETVTELVIPESITEINSYAFFGCGSITKLTLHDNVTSIGSYAFVDCYNLIELTMPVSTIMYMHAFNDVLYSSGQTSIQKTTLTKGDGTVPNFVFRKSTSTSNITYRSKLPWRDSSVIIIEDGVKYINEAMFYSIRNLVEITLPESLIYIGDQAFMWCENLSEIVIPEYVQTIGDSAFENCERLTSINIPDSVTAIGSYAFSDCSNLTEITIPDSVTIINDYTFYRCENLQSLMLGDGLTTIGKYAFYYCENLTNLIIPDSVTAIMEKAFGNCSEIVEITIPISAAHGGEAFSNCKNIKKITLTKGNGIVKDYSGSTNFVWKASGCPNVVIDEGVTKIGGGLFSGCSSLLNITIPDTVKSIGKSAFSGCSSLTKIGIPDGVTYIGERAFYNCINLMEIGLPSQLTSIEANTFSGCKNLIGITIPANVESIGKSAFMSCTNLSFVNWDNSYYKEGILNNGAFQNCSSLVSIVVPDFEAIGTGVFKDCTSLMSARLLDNSLGSAMFSNCTSLMTVYLVSDEAYSTSYIGGNFSDCILLSDVYYTNEYNYRQQISYEEYYYKTYSETAYFLNATKHLGTGGSGGNGYIGTGLSVDENLIVFEKPGESFELSATEYGVDVTNKIKWQSLNTDVATVDGSGMVCAVSNGNTFITVFNSQTNAWDRCAVFVGPPNELNLYSEHDSRYYFGGNGFFSNTYQISNTVDIYIAMENKLKPQLTTLASIPEFAEVLSQADLTDVQITATVSGKGLSFSENTYSNTFTHTYDKISAGKAIDDIIMLYPYDVENNVGEYTVNITFKSEKFDEFTETYSFTVSNIENKVVDDHIDFVNNNATYRLYKIADFASQMADVDKEGEYLWAKYTNLDFKNYYDVMFADVLLKMMDAKQSSVTSIIPIINEWTDAFKKVLESIDDLIAEKSDEPELLDITESDLGKLLKKSKYTTKGMKVEDEIRDAVVDVLSGQVSDKTINKCFAIADKTGQVFNFLTFGAKITKSIMDCFDSVAVINTYQTMEDEFKDVIEHIYTMIPDSEKQIKDAVGHFTSLGTTWEEAQAESIMREFGKTSIDIAVESYQYIFGSFLKDAIIKAIGNITLKSGALLSSTAAFTTFSKVAGSVTTGYTLGICLSNILCDTNGQAAEMGRLVAAAKFAPYVMDTLSYYETVMRSFKTVSSVKHFETAFDLHKAVQVYCMEHTFETLRIQSTNLAIKLLEAWNLYSTQNYVNTMNDIAAKKTTLSLCNCCLTDSESTKVTRTKTIEVKCPVDVYVYDETGEEVVRIINDVIEYCTYGITVLVNGSEKYITVPVTQEYTVKIVATDDGTMSYSVSEYDETAQKVRFVNTDNIILVEGKIFRGAVNDQILPSADSYNLTSGGTTIKPTEATSNLVTNIELSKDSESMMIGDEITLVATIMPNNATIKQIIWTTSNADVATVDEYGNVKAVGVGEAVITATTKDGGYYKTCTVNVVAGNPDLNHTFGDWEIVKTATCTETGEERRYCSECGSFESRSIAVKGHSAGEWKITVNATCIQNGKRQKECINCGEVMATEELPLATHSPSEWIVTIQPTQTSEGQRVQKCTICGVTLKTEILSKLPEGKVHSVAIDNFTMEYKDSAAITPNINVDTGVGYTVSYDSSDSSVVQIDENGNITTRDKGSATITVTVTDEHGNTVTDTCEVTVKYKWWQWIIVIVLFGWIWY